MNGSVLGTVHFLRGMGDWWDLGGSCKQNGLKGGPSQKNKRREGGVTRNILVYVQLT